MSDVTPTPRMLAAHSQLIQDMTRAHSQFLGELCHELRSAITVIGGNADLIVLRHPELAHEMEPIITASDKVDEILRTLLEVTAVDES